MSPAVAPVSVVIAAYTERRWAQLCAAIGSVRAQEHPVHELIVSVDHNPALAARLAADYPDLTIVENGQPRGASGARNSGVLAATGELVAFLDDDASARAGWLQRLVAPLAAPSVAGVGGAVAPAWPAAQGRPDWFPTTFDWVVGASYEGQPTGSAPVRNVWSLNMAVRRADFLRVGGFRAGFGKTGERNRPEDTDLCLRLAAAQPGSHWLYEPAALVDHDVPAARATWSYFLRRCWHEGLGKADLVGYLGADPSLATERAHLRAVLPRVLARDLHSALRGDSGGAQRSAATVAGVTLAAAGLGWGRLRARSAASAEPANGLTPRATKTATRSAA